MRALIPLAIMIAGFAATYYGYEHARPGDHYTIWWGAVVFGGLGVLRALGDR